MNAHRSSSIGDWSSRAGSNRPTFRISDGRSATELREESGMKNCSDMMMKPCEKTKLPWEDSNLRPRPSQSRALPLSYRTVCLALRLWIVKSRSRDRSGTKVLGGDGGAVPRMRNFLKNDMVPVWVRCGARGETASAQTRVRKRRDPWGLPRGLAVSQVGSAYAARSVLAGGAPGSCGNSG